MKILFVVDEIFPDKCGGVHTYIYNVAKGLVGKGHTVFILTQKVTEEFPDTEIIEGINIVRYDPGKNKFSFFLMQILWIINIYKAFKKLSKSHSFDIINLHSPHAALGVNLYRTAKKLNKVFTFCALLREEQILIASGERYLWYQWRKYVKPFWFPIYLFLMKWLEKKGLKECEKIIALSDFTSECLVKTHRVSSDRIVKIPGGVDIESFKPAGDKSSVRGILRLPLQKSILFTVRRLVPRMGLDNLIKAMPAVLEKCPDAVLIIGGEGPLKSELQDLIDKLNLGKKVFLTGLIPSEKLPLYYQASDLFILPTRALEGFGIVTVEALACGVPVLGTPVGGTIEILNKLDKKLLFKDASPRAIADLTIEYLQNNAKRSEIQGRCRQFILENYSWDKIVRQTENLFFEVSSAKR